MLPRYEVGGETRGLHRLILVAGLYLAQGIPWGFATITLAALLAEQGIDEAVIGKMLAAVVLPWSFKFIGGPIVDGICLPGGRRRPWILIAQAGMILTLIGLSRCGLDTPEQLTAWLLAHNIFAALQDVATDALAVDLMSDKERGRANGIMYGAKYGGTAIGGAGIALLIAQFGWSVGTMAQVAFVGLISLLPILLREPKPSPGDGPGPVPMFNVILSVLRRQVFWWTLALCLMIGLPSALLAPLSNTLFIDQYGWTAAEWSVLNGGPGVTTGLVGAVAGGFLVSRYGPGAVGLAAAFIHAAALLIFPLAPELFANTSVVGITVMLQALTAGAVVVASFTLAMRVAPTILAASLFTGLMAMQNLSSTIGYWATAYLPDDPSEAWSVAGAIWILVGGLSWAAGRAGRPDAPPNPNDL